MPDGSAPLPSAQGFLPLETGQMYEFPKNAGPMAGTWTVQGVDPKNGTITLWRDGAKRPTVISPQDLVQRAAPTAFRPPILSRNQRLDINGQRYDLGFFDAKAQKYAISLPNGLSSTIDAQIVDQARLGNVAAEEAFAKAIGSSPEPETAEEKKSSAKKASTKPLALAVDASASPSSDAETEEIEEQEEQNRRQEDNEDQIEEIHPADVEEEISEPTPEGKQAAQSQEKPAKDKNAKQKTVQNRQRFEEITNADIRALREQAEDIETQQRAQLEELRVKEREVAAKIRELQVQNPPERPLPPIAAKKIAVLENQLAAIQLERGDTEETLEKSSRDIIALDRERRSRFQEKRDAKAQIDPNNDPVAALNRTIEARKALQEERAQEKKLLEKALKEGTTPETTQALADSQTRLADLTQKLKTTDTTAALTELRVAPDAEPARESIKSFTDAEKTYLQSKRETGQIRRQIADLQTERTNLELVQNKTPEQTQRIQQIAKELAPLRRQLPASIRTQSQAKRTFKDAENLAYKAKSLSSIAPIALAGVGSVASAAAQDTQETQLAIKDMLELMRIQQQEVLKTQVPTSRPPATPIAQSEDDRAAKIRGLQAQIKTTQIQLTDLSTQKQALDAQIQNLEQQLQTLSSSARDATRVMTITTRIQELRVLQGRLMVQIGQQQGVLFEQQKQLDRLQPGKLPTLSNEDEYQRALDALASPTIGLAATSATSGLATGLPNLRRPTTSSSPATQQGRAGISGKNDAERIQSALSKGRGNLSLDLDQAKNRARMQGYSSSGAEVGQLEDARANMLASTGGLGGEAPLLSMSSLNERLQDADDQEESDESAISQIQNQGSFNRNERRARATQALLQGGRPVALGSTGNQFISQGYEEEESDSGQLRSTSAAREIANVNALNANQNQAQQNLATTLAPAGQVQEDEDIDPETGAPKLDKSYNLDKMWNDAKSFWEIVAGSAEGVDLVIFTVKQNLMLLHTHVAIPGIPLVVNALNGKFSKVTMVTEQDSEDIRLSQPRQGCVVMLDFMLCTGCIISSSFILIQLFLGFMLLYAVTNPGSAIYNMLFGGG